MVFPPTYPVASGLGDIFTDLLGGETERTDLGGKSRLGADLTTCGPQVATYGVRIGMLWQGQSIVWMALAPKLIVGEKGGKLT